MTPTLVHSTRAQATGLRCYALSLLDQSELASALAVAHAARKDPLTDC